MKPAFRLSHVSKRFRRVHALCRVSLEGTPGNVIALLGENGAGKTSAIRILLGLETADSGNAEVLGLSSNRFGTEIRRKVGYVPDQPALYDWMTVDEIGWFVAGFYEPSFLEEYGKLVKLYELPPHQKIKNLSRGMRAKVSLSLAMAHQPELLVLDEPTSGLDPMVRRQFLESMVDVAATGRTVLLSSHQINEVERVADIVAIINKGQLQFVERLEDLKREVRELKVTLGDEADQLPEINADIIGRTQFDRQWKVHVRNFDDEQLRCLGGHPQVRQVEVRVPSLEEIFITYMQDVATDRTPAAESESLSEVQS